MSEQLSALAAVGSHRLSGCVLRACKDGERFTVERACTLETLGSSFPVRYQGFSSSGTAIAALTPGLGWAIPAPESPCKPPALVSQSV